MATPCKVLRKHHQELCRLLNTCPETLDSYVVSLYSSEMIDMATKKEVLRTKGLLGSDTLLDHLMMKVEAKPQRLGTILEIMMEQEMMRDIAEKMKEGLRCIVNLPSPWTVAMVPISANNDTDALTLANNLQDQFQDLLVAINTSTRHTDIDNLRIRIYTFFKSEDPCLLMNDSYLTELKKCQSIEDLLLFLMKVNLIGYLNYKLIRVFVKAAENDEAVKSFFDDYKKEFVKFLQCDLPSIVKVFRNIRVTPLPPVGLPDFTLRIGTTWEHSSLYSFKEVFERRFSWGQDLLILDVTQNCIIIKYAVLPFFVSAVVEDLSNPEVIAELKQQDIIVELSPLLQEMAHICCTETPPITISSSDVTHFLKTHDLTITTQQESRLLDITESRIIDCLKEPQLETDAIQSDQFADTNLEGLPMKPIISDWDDFNDTTSSTSGYCDELLDLGIREEAILAQNVSVYERALRQLIRENKALVAKYEIKSDLLNKMVIELEGAKTSASQNIVTIHEIVAKFDVKESTLVSMYETAFRELRKRDNDLVVKFNIRSNMLKKRTIELKEARKKFAEYQVKSELEAKRAHLRNKSLMDRLQDYEQLKEENEYLDMENDEQAKNYVNLRKECDRLQQTLKEYEVLELYDIEDAEKEKSFKKIIITNMSQLKRYTDIPSLVPYLYKYQLLTPDEHLLLLQSSDQSVHYYTQFLPKKGSKAHVTFYKCLNEAVRDPHCSIGHHSLLKLFNK